MSNRTKKIIQDFPKIRKAYKTAKKRKCFYIKLLLDIYGIAIKEENNKDKYGPDCALRHLLKEGENRIEWPIDNQFHKNFRQIDVISGHIDMAIWHLLPHTNLFWEIYNYLCLEINKERKNNNA